MDRESMDWCCDSLDEEGRAGEMGSERWSSGEVDEDAVDGEGYEAGG